MTGSGRARFALSIIIVVSISVLAVPNSAEDWTEADFWKYSVSEDSAGIVVFGNITYSFEETRTVTVGTASYGANILSISGFLEGSDTIIGIPYTRSITLGGYLYILEDRMALLEVDIMMWTEVAIGPPGFQFAFETETESVTTYSPPLMQGFDPSDSSLGDRWDEDAEVTEEVWTNGTMDDSTTYQMGYDFVISSETEEVITGAGTFEAMKITRTDEDGNTVVYWWSSQVGNYVREYRYQDGGTEPVFAMTLSDYEREGDVDITLFVAVGGIVLAVALVVLGMVMLSRRRPGQPSPLQQAPPPQNQPEKQ